MKHLEREMKKILILTNYPEVHVLSDRGRFFAKELNDFANVTLICRDFHNVGKIKNLINNIIIISKIRPDLIYTIDGLTNEVAAFLAKVVYGTRYIVDTAADMMDGFRLEKKLFINLPVLVLFRIILKKADYLVCRGIIQKIIFESRALNKNIIHISEGVNLDNWYVKQDRDLKNNNNITEESLVIGVIGSVVWCPAKKWAYGVEIIEVLKRLRGSSVYGIILPSITSDDETIDDLEKIAKDAGVDKNLRIIRNINRYDVPDYLAVMDICISTQIPNIIGEMRTTAKIPEYMACGKFIIATNVGDARIYLKQEMLMEYINPDTYYDDLAKKVSEILDNRKILKLGEECLEIAHKNFDIKKLSQKCSIIVKEVLSKDNFICHQKLSQ